MAPPIKDVRYALTTCTAAKPMPFDASTHERRRWTHPDAALVERSNGRTGRMECPHCGAEWKPKQAEPGSAMLDDHVRYSAAITVRLRDVLKRDFSRTEIIALASAMQYELVSMVAASAASSQEAHDFIEWLRAAMHAQVDEFGVGRPHP